MARRIPSGFKDIEQLGLLVDRELQRIDSASRQGYVGNIRVSSEIDSYLFMDKGVLKFFNASTKQVSTVTLA